MSVAAPCSYVVRLAVFSASIQLAIGQPHELSELMNSKYSQSHVTSREFLKAKRPVSEVLECPAAKKSGLHAACPVDTYQVLEHPLPCFNGHGCIDKKIRKGQIENVVSLPAGALGVSLTVVSNADLDMHVKQDGECIVGYKCKFNQACPHEDLSLLKGHRCITYADQEMYYSGDDTTGPIISETFEVDEVKHSPIQLAVEGYAEGEGVALFKYTSYPDCTMERPHGCQPCEAWAGCGEGLRPKCDGSKTVTCVNATEASTQFTTVVSSDESESDASPLSWLWLPLLVIAWCVLVCVSLVLMARRGRSMYTAIPPLVDPVSAEKSRLESELALKLKTPICFNGETSELSPEDLQVIEDVAEVLGCYSKITINIESHVACSCHGTCRKQQLTDQRCVAVKEALESAGCKNEIYTQGFGCRMRIGDKLKVFAM